MNLPKKPRRQGISLKRSQAYVTTKNLNDQIALQTAKNIQDLQYADSRSNTKRKSHNRKINSSIESRGVQKKQKDMNIFREKDNQLTTTKSTNSIKSMNSSRKFKNINSTKSMKNDDNIENTIEQLLPKANNFCRFGFKSYEKNNHKKIFSDVLNIPQQKMNGTLFIGQMWNSSLSSKYLKLNKISMNKMKFLEKMKQLKWQRVKRERQKQLDSSNLINSVKEFNSKNSALSLLSFKEVSSDYLNRQDNNSQQLNKKSVLANAIKSLRGQINTEYEKSKQQSNWKNMKKLQNQSNSLHRIWDNYYQKMLQMN